MTRARLAGIADSVAEDYLIECQLATGWSPRDILIAHYDGVIRSCVLVASQLKQHREARRILAGLGKLKFFSSMAKLAQKSIVDVVNLFKNSLVVKFFGKIKWSFKKLFDLLKRGYKAYNTLLDAIGEYISEAKVGKWTTEELEYLDVWLQKHSKTKHLAGIAIGAMLIYFWFNQSFVGHPEFDFDMTYILAALTGGFSLAKLFGGKDGMKLLVAIATGMVTGASFPWPGPSTGLFIGAILGTLAYKVLGKRLKKWTAKDDAIVEQKLEPQPA